MRLICGWLHQRLHDYIHNVSLWMKDVYLFKPHILRAVNVHCDASWQYNPETVGKYPINSITWLIIWSDLTQWGRVPHICFIKLDHHWFRQWLVTWPAPSHYLNHCWNAVHWTLWNKCQWNCSKHTTIFKEENGFGYVVRKWRPFCLGLNVFLMALSPRQPILEIIPRCFIFSASHFNLFSRSDTLRFHLRILDTEISRNDFIQLSRYQVIGPSHGLRAIFKLKLLIDSRQWNSIYLTKDTPE